MQRCVGAGEMQIAAAEFRAGADFATKRDGGAKSEWMICVTLGWRRKERISAMQVWGKEEE